MKEFIKILRSAEFGCGINQCRILHKAIINDFKKVEKSELMNELFIRNPSEPFQHIEMTVDQYLDKKYK